MRKPNGYGSIKKLSGNRRRPFAFVISENGRQKPVAYFTNQIDAEIFQADYNKIHRHRSRTPNHFVQIVSPNEKGRAILQFLQEGPLSYIIVITVCQQD